MIDAEKEQKRIQYEENLKERLEDYEPIPDIEPFCPDCGSYNVYGISRVVGYFSAIENWNKSKQAELKRRQDGQYDPESEEAKETEKKLWND